MAGMLPHQSLPSLQHRLGLLEVWGIKTLGEPAINLRQHVVSFGALALALPQPTQTHHGPQLERFRLLLPGEDYGLM